MANVNMNFFANLTGSVWSAIISLAFIPVYIHLMGVEAYGLVGVFMSLQAVFSVLDMGLSQTLNRELARLTVGGNSNLILDTVRTLECVYIFCAGLIVVAIVMMSDFIANHWLNPDIITAETIRSAVVVMAVVIGLRWPLTLYIGGLNGLQKQVLLNSLFAGFATAQALGAVLALFFISPTVEIFFAWQLILASIQVLAVRYVFIRLLPRGRARFSKKVLLDIWRFALGITGVALLSTVLTQLDKLLLSKLLSLQDFGFYVFASTAAAIVFKISGPLFNAFLPKFSQMLSKHDEVGLSSVYRKGCQVAALVILPFSCVLAFFSPSILMLWAQNADLVSSSAFIFSLLVIGNAVNGLMALPYAIQLASGWTRLALYQNLIVLIVFVPAVYFLTAKWGGVGAAYAWVAVNLLAMVFGVQVMHLRLVKKEKLYWYFNSVIFPFAAVCAVCAGVYYVFVGAETTVMILLKLLCASIASVVVVALILPYVRSVLVRLFWAQVRLR